MKLFNPESEFNQFMTRLFDMILLNLLFIIGCLPVVTIGASCAALHTQTLKMAEGIDPYIIKGFWTAFRKNFKKATICWLILLVCGILFSMDLGLAMNGGAAGSLMTFLIAGLEVLFLFVFIYIFPLIARYDTTVSGYFRNALLIAIRQFPRTLLLAAIIVGWMLIGMYAPTAIAMFWFVANPLIALSGRALFQDKMLLKVFEKYDRMAAEENKNEEYSAIAS